MKHRRLLLGAGVPSLRERPVGGIAAGVNDLQTKIADVSKVSFQGLLTPVPQASRSGTGTWEIAASSWPPARPLQGAPRLTARPRADPAARDRRASSSVGTAGDPRAAAQTDRRRGAGRSPAVHGPANQRRGVLLSPLTLLCPPGGGRGYSGQSAHMAGAPRLPGVLC